ncbi:tyrosine protein kinase [Marivirga tractuosa]|uniref:non-specific protein-tyrosine kinase n=1 Tax=Marivirga tractuosa (strain ATCC 23168 / DSM 4126 / NBRC 15989 / NCIMB 1408 / VKM B-1430 / H-43) TaxID=643867 RepID=E4TQD2_MARTH|nr:polysaccharide biosynthesis tyrosine autokinase [Marivirga tractuosa]ADR22655.1 capsular exopolysaccharide family [Marivirga tractuosa DSM 4126]BDD16674.1 tyrosine protein kinase [Marivirga tractuosa]
MSNQQTRYQRNLEGNTSQKPQNQESEVVDFYKLKTILKKNLPWAILLIAIAVFVAFIYVRYTNVKFQSYAELKLNKRSEASVFGFNPLKEENSNLNTLSGEVELIRSKLFLKQVIDKLPLDVSYHVIGRFKNEERYRFSPFTVSYEKSCANYDQKFYVDIIDKENFKLTTNPDEDQWINQKFGEYFTFNGCGYKLETTPHFFNTERLFFTISTPESLINYVESNLSVAPENLNANTIKITFEDYNPYKVQAIVEQVSELYTKYSKEQKNKANQLKIEFLNKQLKQTENELSNYETYIEEFTIKNKTVNPSQDVSRLISEMVSMDSILYGINYQLAEINNIQSQLDKDTLSFDKINYLVLPSNMQPLFEEFSELKRDYQMAKTRYKKESQVLLQRNLEINALKDRINNYLNNKVEILQDRKSTILNRKREIENKFNQLPAKTNELNQKMRFYSLYEELYLSLMQKKTEFEIAQAGTLSEVDILTPANLPKDPIGPSTNLIYIGSFAVGFILSFIFIGLRYLLYDEINSIHELERLTNIPIIAKISRLKRYVAKKSGVIVSEKPRSQISEAFRTLRTSLDFIGIKDGKKVISISSTTSGEGKTFISVNLAAILAMSSKKVIILDLDMRKPRAQYAFNLEQNEMGISSILSGGIHWKECINITKTENLHFIPSGILPPNPAELLEGDHFSQLLNELKQEYDIILLDTPPIGLVSDGIIALKKSDHSLFVVRADYSKRSFIDDLHRSLNLNNIQNISIIFNAVKKENKGYGYYQDYYNDNGSRSISTLKRLFNI